MRFVYDDGGRSAYFKATRVGDCGTRAICNATGKDYKEVYDALKALNNGTSCRNGTPRKVFNKYMASIGWEWHPTMFIGQGCKVHLWDGELPEGTLILSLARHYTCVKDGVVYDTWNPSAPTKCVYGYWTPPRDPKYRVGDIVQYKGYEGMVHECLITQVWKDDHDRDGVSIVPTGDYGFEIDLYLEQFEKHLA